jgi:hypothetical protein
MIKRLVSSLALLFASLASAQVQHITPPATCVPGEELIDLKSQGKFICIATNVWKYVPISSLLYTHINVPNGVAGLDALGKLPIGLLPAGISTGGSGGSGTNGSGVRSGNGPPSNVVGQDGDFYIDVASARLNFYGPKVAGVWPSTFVPLVGTSGTSGNTILSGTAAPTSGAGVNGDYFIDKTGLVLYGPKTAGAWPTPGIQLGGGSGSGTVVSSSSYPFDTTTSSTVTISHNLGTKNVVVPCFDSSDNFFVAPYKTLDTNTVVVTIPRGRIGRCTVVTGNGTQTVGGSTGGSTGGTGTTLSVRVNGGTATGATGIDFVDGANTTVSATTSGGITHIAVNGQAGGSTTVTGSGIPAGTTLPSGACTSGTFFNLTSAAQGLGLYNCNAGSWLPYVNLDGSGTLQMVNGSLGLTDLVPQKALDQSITGFWSFSQFSLGAPKTPTSSTAACTQGTVQYDATFLYVCVATNSWKRFTAASF